MRCHMANMGESLLSPGGCVMPSSNSMLRLMMPSKKAEGSHYDFCTESDIAALEKKRKTYETYMSTALHKEEVSTNRVSSKMCPENFRSHRIHLHHQGALDVLETASLKGELSTTFSLLRTVLKDNLGDCEAKLATGADPNSANKMGQTALHVAAIWGVHECRCKAYWRQVLMSTPETISAGLPPCAYGSSAWSLRICENASR